jgi:hypothetical protein
VFVALSDGRYGGNVLNAAAALRRGGHSLLEVCMDAACQRLCAKHGVAGFWEVGRLPGGGL